MILEIALGIVLAFLILDLYHTLLAIPVQLRKNRANREMAKFMSEAMNGLVEHLNSAEHKEHVNARNSSQKAKTASKKAQSSRSKKSVQTTKKGV